MKTIPFSRLPLGNAGTSRINAGWVRTTGAVVCLLALAGVARAQDLEPKAYSASPIGAAFLVVGLARSSGSILTDPTLPVTDVVAKIYGVPVAAGYTFGLFGKLALATAALPYSWGDVNGVVGEEAAHVTRSGLADARIKLSVNLAGNPAMGLREFVRAPRKTIVGTSLTIAAPTGQYYGTKLINLGTNRWGFRPEVGVSVPRGRGTSTHTSAPGCSRATITSTPGGGPGHRTGSWRFRVTRATPSGHGCGRPST